MAQLRFLGGVGSIGSSKVVVEQDGWRVLLDLGPAIPGREGLLHAPVAARPGAELRDRLRVGEAPRIEHLYRAEALAGTGLAGGGDGRSAMFVSHAHIDHVGLIGWVAEDVPIYGSPETVRMLDAYEAAGQPQEGGRHHVRPLAEAEPVTVGPLRVVSHAVDHDVAGACGFVVETEDGVVAYSGDLRLHGRHPERSLGFARQARGAAALVIEGTMLSSDPALPIRDEAAVDRLFDETLERTPGLVLLTCYPRDIERVRAFLALAARRGRRVLWPEPIARFLQAFGEPGVEAYRPDLAAEVRRQPGRFVVQVAVEALPDLLDCGAGPGAVFVHANGEPLGPFQPTWELLHRWLRFLEVPFRSIGTSGHAAPDDLDRLVAEVAPQVVYPLHTDQPHRLLPPPGTRRILPRYGRSYPVAPTAPPGGGPRS